MLRTRNPVNHSVPKSTAISEYQYSAVYVYRFTIVPEIEASRSDTLWNNVCLPDEEVD
jgi:hypothetical protein